MLSSPPLKYQQNKAQHVKTEFVRQLTDYIESYRSIFFINHFDLSDVEDIIRRLKAETLGTEFQVKAFNPSLGQFDLNSHRVIDTGRNGSEVQLAQPKQELIQFLKDSHEQALQAAFNATEEAVATTEAGGTPNFVRKIVVPSSKSLKSSPCSNLWLTRRALKSITK